MTRDRSVRREGAELSGQRLTELTDVTDILALEIDDGDDGQRTAVAAFLAALSESHAAELARMRETLERQCANDLQQAQTAVVESFEALTKSILVETGSST